MYENKCVICSEVIPEGRMVCPICEINMDNDAYNLKRSREINMKSEKIDAQRNLKNQNFTMMILIFK